MKMKVVSENTIFETLSKHDGKIRWHNIQAKAQLLSGDGEVLGTIRFDTYLKIARYSWIEKTGSDYSHEYYGYKGGADNEAELL